MRIPAGTTTPAATPPRHGTGPWGNCAPWATGSSSNHYPKRGESATKPLVKGIFALGVSGAPVGVLAGE